MKQSLVWATWTLPPQDSEKHSAFKIGGGPEKRRSREGSMEEVGLELGPGIRPGPCGQHRGGQTGWAAFGSKGVEVETGSLRASRASPLWGWMGRPRNVEQRGCLGLRDFLGEAPTP